MEYRINKAKFPEQEYKVTFEVWENRGKEVNADEYFENRFARLTEPPSR